MASPPQRVANSSLSPIRHFSASPPALVTNGRTSANRVTRGDQLFDKKYAGIHQAQTGGHLGFDSFKYRPVKESKPVVQHRTTTAGISEANRFTFNPPATRPTVTVDQRVETATLNIGRVSSQPKYDYKPSTAVTEVYQDSKPTDSASVFDRIQRINGKYRRDMNSSIGGAAAITIDRQPSSNNYISSSYAPFTMSLNAYKAPDYPNSLKILDTNSSHEAPNFGVSYPITTMPVTVTDAISDTYIMGNRYTEGNSIFDGKPGSIANIIKDQTGGAIYTGEGFQSHAVERLSPIAGDYVSSFSRSNNREVAHLGSI